ncbi:PmoA family protein [Paludisphaera mucosa]|uniref:PmoA family protein n=1 Tax=Paludisphaera mucosa TaxID=3030827 RepID=A0ABT6FG81_9BACT|nr:PmoA family protein [Paludisphaera mucosa]MDG3006579.1 PmoA family protein [Paludisphaera mucosa]
MRHLKKTFPARFGLATLALAVGCTSAIAQDRRLILRGEHGVPPETPVVLAAPEDLDPGLYTLKSTPDAPAVDGVVVADGERRSFVFIAPETTEPSSYQVSLSTRTPKPGEGVAFTPEGPNLKLAVDGRLLGIHHVDGAYKPFLYPLIGPTGAAMTRAFPIEKVAGEDDDHPHHESFWFTHGKVNGFDFWTVKEGTIRETARQVDASGPVLGRLTTRDDWLDPKGAKVCEDERVLTVYATRALRIFDYDVTLKATEGPVVLGETKEGTFGVRVASTMDVDKKTGGKIRNAEGLEDAAAWGKPSSWVDYSGPVGDETVGIAILNHPQSFRYPTTWHVRTYGLFAANPFGGHDFGVDGYGEHSLAKGESLKFSYRLILHRGGVDAVDLAQRFALYAVPPEASWDAAD